MKRIGFLINPIAGMGGRVGLKGTDDVADEAARRGARPVAHLRARETLRELCGQADARQKIHWITCAGSMGEDALKDAGFSNIEVIYEPADGTSRDDTEAAVRLFLDAGVDLVLFCGGDGTARDVCAVTGRETPIMGIPSGVKMFSGVFGVTPAKTAEILVGFLEGRLTLADVDVLDLDEERYRQGEWAVTLYTSASTPYEPDYTQSAKMLITERTDAEVKDEIAGYLVETIEASPDVLFVLGPGSTVQAIGHRLGIDKTLLGIDAVAAGEIVGSDLDERGLLGLLDRYPRCELVLSPIGAQGFVLGRGNLQLSPEVIRRIGAGNLIVVATPAKLARTPVLRFDTGDGELDAELVGRGFLPVVVGYRRRRLAKAAA
jgi:predicted polyphosphate/ATP-dependent NAD kinase